MTEEKVKKGKELLERLNKLNRRISEVQEEFDEL